MPGFRLKICFLLGAALLLANCVQTNINNPITTNAPPHTEIDAVLLSPEATKIAKIFVLTPPTETTSHLSSYLGPAFAQSFRDAVADCAITAEISNDSLSIKTFAPDVVLTLAPVDYTTLQFDSHPASQNNTQLVSVTYDAFLKNTRTGVKIWNASIKLYPSERLDFLYDIKPDEVLALDIVKQMRLNGVMRDCAPSN